MDHRSALVFNTLSTPHGAGVLPGFERPVLFLDRCKELASLHDDGAALEIGGMVTLARLGADPLVPRPLAEVARSMAGPGIRTVYLVYHHDGL